jgi:hypothetical protein
MSTNKTAPDPIVASHIAKFDELDFEGFSRQKWEVFKKSHADDIQVQWPDGHSTRGLPKHIDDMKAMFTYAPDTRISEHPVKFGSGDWTCVIGTYEGTFTKPMQMNGKTIQPTGKPFKIPMCTIGHWTNGVMDKEYLFWDNLAFMQQVGIAGS